MWIYDHFGIGGGRLANALRLHWALAYLFMLNGLVYLAGLALGGGWRALLPRPSDVAGAVAMMRFYTAPAASTAALSVVAHGAPKCWATSPLMSAPKGAVPMNMTV